MADTVFDMLDYHEVFEKLPDGVTLHDPADGAIIDTNQKFCDMLGYSREELLSLGFDDLHVDDPPYTTERAATLIQRAANEGPQTFEWRDLTKAGTPLPVEVHLAHTTLDGDDRILAVVRDITERKRRERELQQKNERLEEFASVVSHDLRNPLNVAQGRLALARSEYDSEDLERAATAVDRSLTLVEDLLALAREGERVREVEPVNLTELCAGCWENVVTADATLVNETTRRILADPDRLKQLVENLMRNAIEHGGESVTVTIGDMEDGFYVADDGPGIPPEDRDQVFKAGYSSTVEGTGFGLYIVREIAEAHDWDVRVTDSQPSGARFEITDVGFGD